MSNSNINNEEQTQTQTEAHMFSIELAPEVVAVVEKVLPQMGEADSIILPETGGMVLVRDGTVAFESRRREMIIIMIPVKRGNELYYVCTR